MRAKIPVLSILSNNFAMATEDDDMVLSRQKYGSTDISGNYADFAKAMGGYGERVTEPEQVVHALINGIRATQEGTPALLEFITTRDKFYSTFPNGRRFAAPKRPDLAIEVIWTSGGLDKLDVYRKLGVPEVWCWERGAIQVFRLRGERYVTARASVALRGIDLTQLASFLDRPTTSQAIRDYRTALRRTR